MSVIMMDASSDVSHLIESRATMVYSFHILSGAYSTTVRAGLGLATLLMILRLQLHATGGVPHCGRHHEGLLRFTLHGLLCHLQEGFLDTRAFDRTGLVKEHVIVITGPLLTTGGGHLTLRLLIELVANANEGERLGILRSRILVEAVSPATQRLKRLLVSDVVN